MYQKKQKNCKIYDNVQENNKIITFKRNENIIKLTPYYSESLSTRALMRLKTPLVAGGGDSEFRRGETDLRFRVRVTRSKRNKKLFLNSIN